jgi:hypothetical protein
MIKVYVRLSEFLKLVFFNDTPRLKVAQNFATPYVVFAKLIAALVLKLYTANFALLPVIVMQNVHWRNCLIWSAENTQL